MRRSLSPGHSSHPYQDQYPNSPHASSSRMPAHTHTHDLAPDADWLSDHSSPSPTGSDDLKFSPESKSARLPRDQFDADAEAEAEADLHSPPTSASSTSPPSPTSKLSHHDTLVAGPSKPLASRYPRVFDNTPQHQHQSSSSRPRIRGMALTPMTSTPKQAGGEYQSRLPKSQPLSRALFARMAPDTNHAGLMTGSKKRTSQKVIVPTKSFRTTFELGLSSTELARRE